MDVRRQLAHIAKVVTRCHQPLLARRQNLRYEYADRLRVLL